MATTTYPTTFNNGPLVQRVPGVGHEPTTFLRPEFLDEVATAGLRHVDRYCPTGPDHLRGPAALVAEARRMGTLRSEDGPRDHQQVVTEPAYRDEVDARNRERLGIAPLPKRGSAEALVTASKVMVDDRWAMSAATGYQLGESELVLRSETQSRDKPGFIETSESTERLVSSMRAALDEMGLKPGVELTPEARGLVSELQAYDAQLYYAEQSDLGVELPGVDKPAILSSTDVSVEAPDVAPSVDDVVTARQQRFPELRQEAAGVDPAAESEGISLG